MIASLFPSNLRYDRIAWVLFLVILGLLLVSSVERKKNSFADNTEVEVIPLPGGSKLISERDVGQALLRSFGNDLEGTELAYLELERMERVLEEDPFVAEADTYVDQHNILHVRVRQREPILRVLDNRGNNYYLDATGRRMPPSKNFAARVLVATGNIIPYTTDFREKKRNSLKDAFTLATAIMNDEFLAPFIQQIHVNNAGDFVMVPLVGDQKIILGSVHKLDDKINRLKIFYRQGMPYAGWREYETINLKYTGQVVCRK
jgi:cell division protein FtsQ